ncbi:hypothetical protein Hbor_39330 (plasmid) [Halogeometricum borinquense DSM 11551]|uniref:Uncharacterized protein n=1 Tax=Halogeometricum borinquense (strain ATCC 700274 / DSM 11551 / JCM 10706 / KCTC 4070 / PR3) TaxID=469382 RepID=E4NW27_HALBP|nr:hypothetical protein Hbor_39330 [Halogeometricum borinquense DSM 11551]
MGALITDFNRIARQLHAMSDTDYGYITPENLSLFTDLYELTMMQGVLPPEP